MKIALTITTMALAMFLRPPAPPTIMIEPGDKVRPAQIEIPYPFAPKKRRR